MVKHRTPCPSDQKKFENRQRIAPNRKIGTDPIPESVDPESEQSAKLFRHGQHTIRNLPETKNFRNRQRIAPNRGFGADRMLESVGLEAVQSSKLFRRCQHSARCPSDQKFHKVSTDRSESAKSSNSDSALLESKPGQARPSLFDVG